MQRLTAFIALLAVVAVACGAEAEPAAAPATSTTAASTTTTPATTNATTSTTGTQPPTTTTATPTTTTTMAGIVPGEDPDVDAVVAAYEIVFDSHTTYADKEPLLDDPSDLEATVQRYFDTGEITGRVTVEVTAVEIEGDAATITYTILFAGAPTYPDQKGEAERAAGGWQVPREAFCALMTAARVGCPLG